MIQELGTFGFTCVCMCLHSLKCVQEGSLRAWSVSTSTMQHTEQHAPNTKHPAAYNAPSIIHRVLQHNLFLRYAVYPTKPQSLQHTLHHTTAT